MKTNRFIQFFLGSLLTFSVGIAGAQTMTAYNWAYSAGSSSSTETGNAVLAVSGKVYVTGHFSGTATFGSGTANQVSLTSSGGQDIFVARYNTNGTFEAAEKIGSSGSDDGLALAYMTVSLTNYLIVGGTYSDSILVQRIASPASFANGTSITPGVACPGTGAATSFAKDANSKLNVCGYFTNYTATFGSTTLNSSYNVSTFVAKLNNLTTSPVTYYAGALNPSFEGDENASYGIVYANQGSKLYITGYFKDSIKFSASTTNPMVASGVRDIYVAGVNQGSSPNYTLSWAQNEERYGGGSDNETSDPYGIKRDIGWGISQDTAKLGGLYITGRFTGNSTFHAPNSANNLSLTYSGTTGFIVAYNFSSGAINNPSWAGIVPAGANPSWAKAIAADGAAGIYMTGEAYTDVTVYGKGGSTSQALNPAGGTPWASGFVAKFNTTTGALQWAQKISTKPATNTTAGNKISYSSADCAFFITGNFDTNTKFGNVSINLTGSGTEIFTASAARDLELTESSVSCISPGLPASITMQAYSNLAGGYSWSGTGITTATNNPNTASVSCYGAYTYTVTTTGGTCAGMTGTTTLEVHPSLTANAGSDQSGCDIVTIGTADPCGSGASYSWSPTTGLSSSTAAQPTSTWSGSNTYTLTVTDFCGNVTTDVVNTLVQHCRTGSTAGNDPADASFFNVFPNPGNGAFTIETGMDSEKTIVVTDVTGRTILQVTTKNSTIPLNLQNEPSGLYVVHMIWGDQSIVQKLIKE